MPEQNDCETPEECEWVESEGEEPPYDICVSCGARRD